MACLRTEFDVVGLTGKCGNVEFRIGDGLPRHRGVLTDPVFGETEPVAFNSKVEHLPRVRSGHT